MRLHRVMTTVETGAFPSQFQSSTLIGGERHLDRDDTARPGRLSSRTGALGLGVVGTSGDQADGMPGGIAERL